MAIIARTEFASAINQVASERGIEVDVVLDSIKSAIVAAYKKDYDPEGEEDITIELNSNTGEVEVFKKGKNVTPSGFGRIAAQTAKQVILQKIREAEKEAILGEFGKKVGSVVSGIVQRASGSIVTVNLGKAEGIIPPFEQSPSEEYTPNKRMRFFIKEVKETSKGEEIVVSRRAPELLEGLFRAEVPEIQAGSVEIKSIAREAGSRSKVAVWSNQAGVDPVGSCVGQKGIRVQNVINELGDEKIDIVSFSEDAAKFIAQSLAPAKDLSVKVDEKNKEAEVLVAEDELSLAIGKDGQNVRLAARLTGYKIDIKNRQEKGKKTKNTKDKTETKTKTKAKTKKN